MVCYLPSSEPHETEGKVAAVPVDPGRSSGIAPGSIVTVTPPAPALYCSNDVPTLVRVGSRGAVNPALWAARRSASCR